MKHEEDPDVRELQDLMHAFKQLSPPQKKWALVLIRMAIESAPKVSEEGSVPRRPDRDPPKGRA